MFGTGGVNQRKPLKVIRLPRELNWTVTNVFVLGEHDPALLAHIGQPNLILGILREMVIVDSNVLACLPQNAGNDFAAQGAINKEDQLLREAPRRSLSLLGGG